MNEAWTILLNGHELPNIDPALVTLEITDGKSTMDVPVTVAAGKKKTITVKPSKALLKETKSHPKARLSVRLVAPEGKAQKVKAG